MCDSINVHTKRHATKKRLAVHARRFGHPAELTDMTEETIRSAISHQSVAEARAPISVKRKAKHLHACQIETCPSDKWWFWHVFDEQHHVDPSHCRWLRPLVRRSRPRRLRCAGLVRDGSALDRRQDVTTILVVLLWLHAQSPVNKSKKL